MLFRTEFPAKKSKINICHSDFNFFIGSCFTENIGNTLTKLLFPTEINPFGIVYNPFSVLDSLERLFSRTEFSEDEIYFHKGLWHSFSHHGKFSNPDKNLMLEEINTRLINSAIFFQKTTHLFISLGTAFVYEAKDSGKIAANCHKLPSDYFTKHMLDKNEIVEAYTKLFEKHRPFFQNIQVIFTVSPVRHLKDGFTENSLSKAVLLTSIDELSKKFPFCSYFPAYEIMIDDLRDYRFYDNDMAHPARQAVEYIFSKFSQMYFTDKTQQICNEINQLNKLFEHRPIHENIPEYRLFIEHKRKKVHELEQKFPEIDFSAFSKI